MPLPCVPTIAGGLWSLTMDMGAPVRLLTPHTTHLIKSTMRTWHMHTDRRRPLVPDHGHGCAPYCFPASPCFHVLLWPLVPDHEHGCAPLFSLFCFAQRTTRAPHARAAAIEGPWPWPTGAGGRVQGGRGSRTRSTRCCSRSTSPRSAIIRRREGAAFSPHYYFCALN
jgi:hypothetical protein